MSSLSPNKHVRSGIRSKSLLSATASIEHAIGSELESTSSFKAAAHTGAALSAIIFSALNPLSTSFNASGVFTSPADGAASITAGILDIPLVSSLDLEVSPRTFHDGEPTQTGSTPGEPSAYGWVQYADRTFTQELTAGTRTLLDLTGLSREIDNLDDDIVTHNFFSGGRFRPYGVTPGGKYRFRLNLTAVSDIIDNNILLELDIGGGFGSIDNSYERILVDSGSPQLISPSFDFYTYDTFLQNGGEVYATSRTGCTLTQAIGLITVELV